MRRITALLSLTCLMLLLAASALAAPQAQQQERRVALIIGNGAYKAGPLKNPANDARDMAAALKSVGFEVILRENAGLRAMNEAIDQFWQNLKRGGVGLFFFAGHGLQVGGENFLVPVDAKIALEKDVQYECVNAGKVLGRMEDAGNGLNIVILDACRNNPFARSFRSDSRGLAKMDAPSGSLVAFATAPGDVAADGEGKNGLYTAHLLRHLRTPGLTIEKVLKQTRIGVAADSARMGKRQTPWESSSLMGDFYFAGGGAAPVSAPLPAPVQASAPVPASLPAANAISSEIQKVFNTAPAGQAPARPSPTLAALPPADSGGRLEARKNAVTQARIQAQAAAQTPAQPQAWLGLNLAEVDASTAKALGLDKTAGAFVREVVPGSPAEAAGLKAGDVVLAVEGQALDGPKTLVRQVASASPGSMLRLGFWRQRQMREVAAILGQPPSQSAAAASPAQIQGPGQGQELAGLKVRLIYTDDMKDTADKVEHTLRDQGVTVQMVFFKKNDSYHGHIRKLYAASGYEAQAGRIAELIRPYESVNIIHGNTSMGDGQQFNLWIAR